MATFPEAVAYQIYKPNSLSRVDNSELEVQLENNLVQTSLVKFNSIRFNEKPINLGEVYIIDEDGKQVSAEKISKDSKIMFHLYDTLKLRFRNLQCTTGKMNISLDFTTREFGDIDFTVADELK
jgi:hypothetical protein